MISLKFLLKIINIQHIGRSGPQLAMSEIMVSRKGCTMAFLFIFGN